MFRAVVVGRDARLRHGVLKDAAGGWSVHHMACARTDEDRTQKSQRTHHWRVTGMHLPLRQTRKRLPVTCSVSVTVRAAGGH